MIRGERHETSLRDTTPNTVPLDSIVVSLFVDSFSLFPLPMSLNV